MKVFISWSGNKSNKVAMAFREWLPSVIQSIEPYVSSEDIDKGARWSTDIAKELENSSFGILCVTKDNINAPWLTFEAGALSKTIDKSHVTPFLFDIKRSEVDGPILQFQSTIFEKEDIRKLMQSLNKACGDKGLPPDRLDKAFDIWYQSLENQLNSLKELEEETKTPDEEQAHTIEVIEEILDLSRDNQKLLKNPDSRLYERVEGLKEQLDEILLKINIDSSREVTGFIDNSKTEVLNDMLRLYSSDLITSYRFLIALGMLKAAFPWIYDFGKFLLDIIFSQQSYYTKKEHIEQFRRLVKDTLRTYSDSMISPNVSPYTRVRYLHDSYYAILQATDDLEKELDKET